MRPSIASPNARTAGDLKMLCLMQGIPEQLFPLESKTVARIEINLALLKTKICNTKSFDK